MIGYAHKRLPFTAVNNSITEFDLFGLCVNICQFIHLPTKVDSDYKVGHLALTYIMKR